MESHCPPIFVAIIVLVAALIFLAPRNHVLGVFLASSVIIGMDYHIIFLNLNFFSVRIFLLLAWLRVLARGEQRGLKSQPLDKALFAFCCAMVAMETIRRGGPGLIYSVANYFFDSLGTYYLFRALLREREDLHQTIRWLSAICCVLAAFMTVEKVTQHNWLEPLGAIKNLVDVRDGKVRCQATFLHPVLAGTFGAVILPLFIASWRQSRQSKQSSLLAAAGCVVSTVIVLWAGSSGPLMTYAAVVIGLLVWRFRHWMRAIRWGLLVTILSLHVVMKAPVWALIARASSLTGGSGYHRFNILDTYISHIGDWWLIGINSTNWGWLTEDVANQYCIIAKHGGLLSLLLFVRLLAAGFRAVGNARRKAEGDWPTEFLVWSFGAVLFGHIVTFLGTSYFDQTYVLWYLNLAMLASLQLLAKAPVDTPEPASARGQMVHGPIQGSQGAFMT